MVEATLNLRALNRATLARQLLLERQPLSVVDAVERLCGMQAQEPKPPFVGLWSRLQDFKDQQLHQEINRHSIVRATLMRTTLHLFSARDYSRLRMPLQPALNQAMRVLGKRTEGIEMEALLAVAQELLEPAPLTFNELRALLIERFPKADDRALGYMVRIKLPLIMVPQLEQRWGYPAKAKFTLAQQHLAEPLVEDQDPKELVSRYLAAFGPATVADIQTWSGLKGLKPVVAGLQDQLVVFKDENGRTLFDLPDAPRPDQDTPAPVRFLPAFDNLVLSHADRTRIIADDHRPLIVTKNLRVHPTFQVDGFAAGMWEITVKRSLATLKLKPFEPLKKQAVKELTAEGQRLLKFVEPNAKDFKVELVDI